MAQWEIFYTVVTTRTYRFELKAPAGEDAVAEAKAIARLQHASKAQHWPGEMQEEDVEFEVESTDEI